MTMITATDVSPWSVVVVDDRPTNRTVYSQLIRGALDGVTVHGFSDPCEALAWLHEHTPDLVVTDFNMPVMDGAEFIARLRAQAADGSVPVVVLTAYDDRGSRKRALRAGATDFLVSPVVDFEEFSTRVRNLARLGRQQRLLQSRAASLADELGQSEASRRGALRESSVRLAQVIDSVPAMISATGLDGACIFANAGAMTQEEPADELRRQSVMLDQHVLTTGQAIPAYEETVTGVGGEIRNVLTSKVPLRNEAGQITAVLTTSLDITERKRAETRLRHLARQDGVTGVANHDHFCAELARAVARSRRGDKGFALHYVDLDHFKRVNDGYGHHVGDALLKEVAARLVAVVGSSGLVGRLGGDEFGILQHEGEATTGRDAATLAERVARALAAPVVLPDTALSATASIGIALSPKRGRSCDALLRGADSAMYRAKLDGRDCYRVVEGFSDRAADAVEDGLRLALQSNHLVLHYQRQFEAHSGGVVGAEALLRWRRPGWGLVGPGAFLATAERTGLALPISTWVLGRACAQAASWREAQAGPARLCVNVSPSQALDPEFAWSVRSAIDAVGLAPEALTLDLTEAMLAEATPPLLRQLTELRDAGVGLGIDDFGVTGLGTGLVRRLPLSVIRIDQSVVRALGSDDETGEIVGDAVALGRLHGIEVAAVGVETAQQRDQLRDAGVAVLQGFFFALPEPADDLVACSQPPPACTDRSIAADGSRG